MKSHRTETVQLSIETAGYSATVANRMYDRLVSQLSSDGKFEPKALEKLRASFIDLKILDSSVDMSKLYTTNFLPRI
jgi:hypothetical protein